MNFCDWSCKCKIISQQISKIHDFFFNYQIWILSQLIFFKCAIVFSINTLFLQKSAKFVTNCRNMNFSQSWYFFNDDFIFHKCIIVLLKIDKIRYFVPLNDELNFLSDWHFLNEWIFLFFPWMRYYSTGNQQNSQLTLEMWIFLAIDTFERAIYYYYYYFHKYAVILPINGENCISLSKYELFSGLIFF